MASVTAFPDGRGLGVNLIFDTAATNTTANDIESGATTVYGLHAINAHSAKVYLNVYNTAAPVQGTTPQSYQFPVAANGGTLTIPFPGGLSLSNLSWSATTDAGTTATTAPGTTLDVYFFTNGGA